MNVYPLPAVRPLRIFDLADGFLAARGLLGPRPRPLGRVAVRLIAEQDPVGDRPWPGQPELVLIANRDGFRLFYGGLRTVGGGVTRPRLAGRYAVRIESELYQPEDLRDVDLPATGAPPLAVVLSPGPSYRFPVATSPAATRTGRQPGPTPGPTRPTVVRGTLRDPDGRPIAGARISARGAQPAFTTGHGDWLLYLPEPGPVPPTLSVTFPGQPPVDAGELPVQPGRESVLPADTLTQRLTEQLTAAGRSFPEPPPS